MRDNDIKRLWGRDAVPAWWADTLPRFRAIVEAAAKEGAAEEREECERLRIGLVHVSETTDDPELAQWAFRYIDGSAELTDSARDAAKAVLDESAAIRSRAAVQSAAEGEGEK